MKAKQFYLMISFICFGMLSTAAQSNEITISGTVIESGNNLPIEFATVLIADNTTKKPLTGTTTNDKGIFKFTTNASNFYIEVRFIGFSSKKITTFKIH